MLANAEINSCNSAKCGEDVCTSVCTAMQCALLLSSAAFPHRKAWTFDASCVSLPGFSMSGSIGQECFLPCTLEVRGNSRRLGCPSTCQEKGGGRIDSPWPGMCSREIPPKVEPSVRQPPRKGKGVLVGNPEATTQNK